MKRDTHFVCSNCGYIGRGLLQKKGSRLMEWIMWGVFLIPGPFYSLWRYMTRYKICPKCRDEFGLVSLDTPEGERLFQESARRWR